MKTIVRNPDAVIILLLICGMLLSVTKNLNGIQSSTWIDFLHFVMAVEVVYIMVNQAYVDGYIKANAKFNFKK